ncbi:ECF transporter S component [Ruania alkalisoli]|uniref:ECF transporter S component n=1 Tax=Ruania alkalisoli TaxID=2779775 RepID=A0A7M1SVA8_9MICO|nr:ECF transporter S component [Ruania alkalisoli]QOR71516.1 ECF transporter S component [Ruania alkalisoli]
MSAKTPRRRPVTLHDLVLLAVLAVVFGFLYWALVQVWGWMQVAMGPLGDLAQNVLVGGWMVVAPLALYIVRKPGAGIVVEIVASIVEVVFLASPVGPMLILVGLIQGAGAEVAFTATRYRRYGWWVFVASGITAALANLALGMVRFGWMGQDFFALRVGFQFASGIILCGLLAKVIGDALLRTGVLDNYAIGRAARESERATSPSGSAGTSETT